MKGMTYQQKKKFFADVRHYLWEDRHLFQIGADQIIRRCVDESEAHDILCHCHEGPTNSHKGANYTAKIMFDCRLSLRMCRSLLSDVMRFREQETSHSEMRCPKPPFRLSRYLMFGALTSWYLPVISRESIQPNRSSLCFEMGGG